MTSPRMALPLRESALFQRLLRGFGWSVAGVVLGRVATLLASIIVAREIGRHAYGEFALLQSTTVMLGELGGLGAGVAAAKLLGQYRISQPQRAGGIVTLNLLAPAVFGSLLALALWMAREPVAAYLFENPGLSPLITFIALSLFFASINGAIAGVLTGLEQFRGASLLMLAISVLTATGQIVMVRRHGIDGVLMAVILANAAGTLLGVRFLLRSLQACGLRIDMTSARRELITLWSINVPAMMSALLVVPVTWATGVILARQPQGYAELAVFNIANQWKMAMLIAPTVLGNVLLPTLARLAGGDDHGRFRQAIRLQLLANGAGAALVVVLMCAGASTLLGFYGEDYQSDTLVLWLMFAVAGLMTVNAVVGNALTSAGHLWMGLSMNAAWALVLLAAAWLLCPAMGAAGLAWAYLAAYVAHTLWQCVALRWVVFS